MADPQIFPEVASCPALIGHISPELGTKREWLTRRRQQEQQQQQWYYY